MYFGLSSSGLYATALQRMLDKGWNSMKFINTWGESKLEKQRTNFYHLKKKCLQFHGRIHFPALVARSELGQDPEATDEKYETPIKGDQGWLSWQALFKNSETAASLRFCLFSDCRQSIYFFSQSKIFFISQACFLALQRLKIGSRFQLISGLLCLWTVSHKLKFS